MEHTLRFNENKLEYFFSVEDKSPFLIIKHVLINSLYGQKPNEWSPKLLRLNPILEITFNKYHLMMNGFLKQQLVIDAFNLPHYYNPIFTIGRKYPDTFDFSEADRMGIQECSIKLLYTDQADVKPEISILVDATPGMLLRKKEPIAV